MTKQERETYRAEMIKLAVSCVMDPLWRPQEKTYVGCDATKLADELMAFIEHGTVKKNG